MGAPDRVPEDRRCRVHLQRQHLAFEWADWRFCLWAGMPARPPDQAPAAIITGVGVVYLAGRCASRWLGCLLSPELLPVCGDAGEPRACSAATTSARNTSRFSQPDGHQERTLRRQCCGPGVARAGGRRLGSAIPVLGPGRSDSRNGGRSAVASSRLVATTMMPSSR